MGVLGIHISYRRTDETARLPRRVYPRGGLTRANTPRGKGKLHFRVSYPKCLKASKSVAMITQGA